MVGGKTSELYAPTEYQYGDGFQAKVVGLCLRDPGFLQSHRDVVQPAYFSRQQLGTIAHLIIEYFKKHYNVPTRDAVITMVHDYARDYGGANPGEVLSGLLAWVDTIYAFDLTDSEFVTDHVVQFGQRQAFKAAIGKGLDMLEKREEDLSRFREVFDEALRVGTVKDLGMDFASVALALPELFANDPIYGLRQKVPTGLEVLDQRLFGGVGTGEVCIVAGTPGRGKTTLLVNMAKHAAQWFRATEQCKTVIYFTLEGGMKEPDILLKLAGSMTGVPMNAILSGSPYYTERMQSQLERLWVKGALHVKYFAPGTVAVEDLRWYVANLVSRDGVEPGAIFVDYGDKLKDMRDDRYSDAGTIIDRFTTIGDKFHCPVFNGSQINRDHSMEWTVGGEGLAESWLKYANADVVLTLNQTPDEYSEGVMRVFMAKVRKGQGMGTIYCHWSGDSALMYSMTKEETEEQKKRHPPEDYRPQSKGKKGR